MQDGGRSIWPYFQRGACVVALSALAACASRMDGAPVVDRTGGMAPGMSTNAPSDQPPGPPPPGYYRVQPGDTLYRVALQNGQNYRDIATWNNLSNPNQIEVGQLLRVAPPGANLSAMPGGVATAPLGGNNVQTSSLGAPPYVAPNAPPYAPPSGGASPGPGAANPSPYPSPYASDPANPEANAPSGALVNGPVNGPTNGPNYAAPTPYAPPVMPTPAIAPTTAAPAPDTATPSVPGGPVSFMWPVKGPMLHTFNGSNYKGIDIGGVAGTPILAAAGGRVLYAGSGLRGYGNLIIIKHDNSFLTAYAHNRTLLVHENDAVTKGQKIAEMGDTGANQVMLHFEVRKDTKPVDPMKFLPSQ